MQADRLLAAPYAFIAGGAHIIGVDILLPLQNKPNRIKISVSQTKILWSASVAQANYLHGLSEM
jgi:hypothetical protein